MYRCILLIGVALISAGCCQFDEDCVKRQMTEKQLEEVRAGKRTALMHPHPDVLRDFANEKSAENIELIAIEGDVRSPSFAALTKYPNLQHIHLYETHGTDELLKNLEGAKKLVKLQTDSDDISDVGLESIAKMPALEQLIIFCNTGNITVEGIKKLSSSKTLKSLDPGLLLNEAEKKEIHEALPDFELEFQ